MKKTIYSGPFQFDFYYRLNAFLRDTELIDSHPRPTISGAVGKVSFYHAEGTVVLEVCVYEDILHTVGSGVSLDISKPTQNLSLVGYGKKEDVGEIEKKILRDVFNPTVEAKVQ